MMMNCRETRVYSQAQGPPGEMKSVASEGSDSGDGVGELTSGARGETRATQN